MSSELLSFQPAELRFPYFPVKPGKLRKFELKKQISCSLRLINNTDDYVAFKVKTTSPKKYSVRPNAGTVAPQSSMDIVITMQSQRESPPDMNCRDKFLVQSVRAPNGLSANNVTQDLFVKEEGRDVFESKLKVYYIPPPQPPSPVAEAAEEGVSPTDEEHADWSEPPKDPVELESMINEARAALENLEQERGIADRQTEKLQQELAKSPASSSEHHVRFSLVFVFIVGFLGVLLGYYLRH